MCAEGNEYQTLARKIKLLFETRFGEFSSKDFKVVAKLLGFDLLPLKLRSTFNEYYERLSDKERADIDFMMHM